MLRKTMSIPAFHDDQHGTAIISGAALLNALELVGKKIDQVRVVFNGAGAAGLASALHYVRLGVRKENITMCDIFGVIYEGRAEGMNPYNSRFAVKTSKRRLAEVLEGADVFVGLSVGDCVTPEMLQPMAERPIIFALANPNPEIRYEKAKAARPDAIVATGRSDFPNQVNNVLGFPGIFRGALDVRARAINEEMKVAATHALSALAKEDVPDSVLRAYGLARLQFGPEYINPKPFDPRALIWVSAAVAEAAMRTGVAQVQINLSTYRDELARRLARTYGVMQNVRQRAQAAPKRIVFSEGENDKVLRASHQIIEERIAYPILLGRPEIIEQRLTELGFEDACPKVIDPAKSPHFEAYAQEFYRLRRRGGVTLGTAHEQMLNANYFGAMMVHMGDADGFVAGVSQNYPDIIRPALQIIKTRQGVHRVAAVFVIVTKKDVYFFADTHVNIDPTAEDLAEIAVLAAEVAHDFDIEPRVAMLSFSNFGSNHHPQSEKMRRAVELALEINPDLMIDGEMMADTALVPEIMEEEYPFSNLKGGATVLVFPDLAAANIAYKMMMRIGGAESLGPILMGLSKSVHVLQRGATVEEIVNMAAIAVVDAQKHSVHLQVVPRAPAA